MNFDFLLSDLRDVITFTRYTPLVDQYCQAHILRFNLPDLYLFINLYIPTYTHIYNAKSYKNTLLRPQVSLSTIVHRLRN